MLFSLRVDDETIDETIDKIEQYSNHAPGS